MKLSEVAPPIDRQAHEEKRLAAIKTISREYKQGRMSRQTAAQRLTSRGLGPKQIQTLLGPETNDLSEGDAGHDVISTPRLMRIIMHLTQLMREWRSRGQDQPANDLRGVLRQHGLMESTIKSLVVDEHYKKQKAQQMAKLDKQIADTKAAVKTNTHVVSRASMMQNIEDLEYEKDKLSQFYLKKYGIAEGKGAKLY